MAGLDSEFWFLAAAVRRSVDLLRTHPHCGHIRDGERGSALLEHVKCTLTGIDDKLADALQSYDDATNTEKVEYVKRARLLNSYARFMHKSVPWISAAAHPSLSLGALYFIDEVGELVCGSRMDAIPVAGADFSTEWWPFRALLEALGLSAQPGPTPIVLNFPELETLSHFLLPLYGHELGHTTVEANDLVKSVLDAHAEDKDLSRAFNKTRDLMAQSGGQTKREAEISLSWRLHWWITEMICDQLAIQALGPSFLFAFSSFLLGDAWDEPGERHPPTCLRIAHLTSYMEQSDWAAEMRDRAPVTMDWLDGHVAKTNPKSSDDATTFLLYAIGRMREAIRTETAAYLATRTYITSDFAGEIAKIVELTENDALPAQLPNGEAVDRRTTMLAGWLSILEPADHPDTLATAPADNQTQAFFAKAIEMSAVLSAWKATS